MTSGILARACALLSASLWPRARRGGRARRGWRSADLRVGTGDDNNSCRAATHAGHSRARSTRPIRRRDQRCSMRRLRHRHHHEGDHHQREGHEAGILSGGTNGVVINAGAKRRRDAAGPFARRRDQRARRHPDHHGRRRAYQRLPCQRLPGDRPTRAGMNDRRRSEDADFRVRQHAVRQHVRHRAALRGACSSTACGSCRTRRRALRADGRVAVAQISNSTIVYNKGTGSTSRTTAHPVVPQQCHLRKRPSTASDKHAAAQLNCFSLVRCRNARGDCRDALAP